MIFTLVLFSREDLGSVYSQHQCQCSVIAAMTLATQLSLTTLENTWSHSKMGCKLILQVTRLWSMRACLEHHHSIDAKLTLTLGVNGPLMRPSLFLWK